MRFQKHPVTCGPGRGGVHDLRMHGSLLPESNPLLITDGCRYTHFDDEFGGKLPILYILLPISGKRIHVEGKSDEKGTLV